MDLEHSVHDVSAESVAPVRSSLPALSTARGSCSASSTCCWAAPQVTLAVNKCENVAVADQQAADFWALGLEPIAVSAISGSGTGDLLDHLAANLPALREDALEVEPDRSQVAVAIVGRPNVGKSSLVNAITGRRCFHVVGFDGADAWSCLRVDCACD